MSKNPSEASYWPDQNGRPTETRGQEVLGRVWAKEAPGTLLVGMEIAAASVESSAVIPQQICFPCFVLIYNVQKNVHEWRS